MVRPVFAGNIERSAVIDGTALGRPSETSTAVTNAISLIGMAVVVILRDHHVEGARIGPVTDHVGRDRPLRVNAFGTPCLHPRFDPVVILNAEQPVRPSTQIDAGDGEAGSVHTHAARMGVTGP